MTSGVGTMFTLAIPSRNWPAVSCLPITTNDWYTYGTAVKAPPKVSSPAWSAAAAAAAGRVSGGAGRRRRIPPCEGAPRP